MASCSCVVIVHVCERGMMRVHAMHVTACQPCSQHAFVGCNFVPLSPAVPHAVSLSDYVGRSSKEPFMQLFVEQTLRHASFLI